MESSRLKEENIIKDVKNLFRFQKLKAIKLKIAKVILLKAIKFMCL